MSENLISSNGGEQKMFDDGKLKLLYNNRNDLINWSIEELYQKLCSTPSGIEILHEDMNYGALVKGGAIDYMVEKKLWVALAYFGIYNRINWYELREEFRRSAMTTALPSGHQNDEKKTVGMVYYESIAKAKKYELMAIDQLFLFTLFRKKFGLWLKSFSEDSRRELLFELDK